MTEEILERLKNIEAEKGIKILFACESGSRGWGFHSPDSDFDVRFVYLRPQDWYVSIRNRPDFMDFAINDDLDFKAWDIKKLLGLIFKSNASPLEWLQSPTIYQDTPNFREELMPLVRQYFNPRHTANHYLGICQNSLKAGIVGDEFKLKKYFYVLRPLLAAKWVVDKRTVPPMEFAPLLENVEDLEFLRAIDELLEVKKDASEGAVIARIPVIDAYVERELARCREICKTIEVLEKDSGDLDAYFRKVIGL